VTLHAFPALQTPAHHSLELAAARALAQGDVAAAFRAADRRCRIRPLPEAHCYVLRAEALAGLGDRAAALDDLATALAIAPEDLAANRRLLAWGDAAQKHQAAHALVAAERDARRLEQPVALLLDGPVDAVGALHRCGDEIEGWAAWRGAAAPELVIHLGEQVTTRALPSDPADPLAQAGRHAARFRIALPAKGEATDVALRGGDLPLATLRVARRGRTAVRRPVATSASDAVTVIVPVHGDVAATGACLDSLLAALPSQGRHRVLIVDDASPDSAMAGLLARHSGHAAVQIIRHARNQGFVGAVNSALAMVAEGDVILLNADTVVPPGFIDRLAAAAHSAPDIGTVTPLSNNGEFTSFPLPNRSNPDGDAATVARIDRLAAEVNAGRVVDLPNGIGFCLYVTRACLDAVGELSESYRRGYLEDVDFCLRARQHGFRNVCAAAVYVGHAGSRSFGEAKRALVVRNLAVIDQRFPSYRDDCAAFLLADPLAEARRALALRLVPRGADVLLVATAGVVADIAAAHARERAGEVVQLLTVTATPAGPRLQLRGSDAMPFALDLDLGTPDGSEQFALFLREGGPRRLVLFDIAALPAALVDPLLALGVPHDVAIVQDGIAVAPHDLRIVQTADRLLVPDRQADAAALRLTVRRRRAELALPAHAPVAVRPRDGALRRLGLLALRGDARERDWIRRLVASLGRLRPALAIMVLGDLPGLALPGAGITGRIAPDDLPAALAHHGIDGVMLCLQQPLYGHPLARALAGAGVPVAGFDWTGGARPDDGLALALDPRLPAPVAIRRLLRWIDGEEAA
jgi:GT2 family glycosyltransferase